MNAMKAITKSMIVMAALGLGLAGCEQRSADTSGDSGAGATPGTLGQQGSSASGGQSATGGSGGTSN